MIHYDFGTVSRDENGVVTVSHSVDGGSTVSHKEAGGEIVNHSVAGVDFVIHRHLGVAGGGTMVHYYTVAEDVGYGVVVAVAAESGSWLHAESFLVVRLPFETGMFWSDGSTYSLC